MLLWKVRSSCCNYLPPWIKNVYFSISFTCCYSRRRSVPTEDCNVLVSQPMIWSLVGDCWTCCNWKMFSKDGLVPFVESSWLSWLVLVASNRPTAQAARKLLICLCEVNCWCNESSILTINSYKGGVRLANLRFLHIEYDTWNSCWRLRVSPDWSTKRILPLDLWSRW